MNETLDYYNQHATEFTADTQNCDMTEKYFPFLSRVKSGGHILDLGCGSGRDSAYFMQHGYQVTAMDGSEEMCRVASNLTGLKVEQMLFQDITWQNVFDGVWACSSLLHCYKDELPTVLQKVADSLKSTGTLYVSFKYGDFEGTRNGRYFTNLTESMLEDLIKDIPEFKIEETSITGDVRPGRGQELWSNAIITKTAV